ncbi:MAG: M20/M25/M40 family metallo-hydrolase [Candidatus Latescibacterota bacterium]|nr:M20/M25/M40 family metallo-hydrolase [Candidatus Latescibacterota bacterium]
MLVSIFLVRVSGDQVTGIAFTEIEDIQSDLEENCRLRFVSQGMAIISCSKEVEYDRILFKDKSSETEEYYLIDHLHSLPKDVKIVYAKKNGWALLRVSTTRAAELRFQLGLFLWPLPKHYSFESTQRRFSAKILRESADSFIHELLESVSERNLRSHVRNLSLLDTLSDSKASNLRSRFALHPQLRESTEYIRLQLVSSLPKVELQPFPIETRRVSSHVKREIEVTDSIGNNVIGTIPGTDSEAGSYIICAHYDATAVRTSDWDWEHDPAPGADDNASGVALVIESARILSRLKLPWSIHFIAFSGEELGLLGSKYYAENALKKEEKILGVFNFDMIGFNDTFDRLELVSNPASNWMAEQMQDVNRLYGIGLRIDILSDGGARLSDHAPFWARGYDAILGIENYLPTDPFSAGVVEGFYRINSQYHSVVDTPDSLNYDLIRRTTQLAVATLAQYGASSGKPNLAVFEGDLRGNADDFIAVRVNNIGTAKLDSAFSIQIDHCDIDSVNCENVFRDVRQDQISQGSSTEIQFPWSRYGEMVFRISVETNQPEDNVEDNEAFQRLYLIPQSKISVFPNPFYPKRDGFLHFAGPDLRGAIVRIYDVDGTLVWEGQEDDLNQRRQGARSNEVLWAGVNDTDLNGIGGARLSSGIYIYTIHDKEEQLLKRDKIAILR